MVYFDNGKYRIASIMKLFDGERPTAEGLGIEKKCINSDEWYVIAFVRYDKNEKDYCIDVVGHRIEDVDADDWVAFKEIMKCAGGLVQISQTSSDGGTINE